MKFPAAALVLATVPSTVLAQPDGPTSVWVTGQGTLILPQSPRDGMEVRGTYAVNGGRVYGVLRRQPDGGWILTGEWEEISSRIRCEESARWSRGRHWGRIEFRIDAEYTNFIGTWGHCNGIMSGTWNGRRAGARKAPVPPAPADEPCDWRKFFQIIRDDGTKLIDEFENDTRLLVGPDKERVIDAKLYPYNERDVRAGFVSYDENAALLRLEKLIGEMIANQGADDWLKSNRKQVIDGMRTANRKYWQAAYSGEKCITINDPSGQQDMLLSFAMGKAPKARIDDPIGEELGLARKLRDDYMTIIFRKMGNTGSFGEKLKRVADDGFERALGNSEFSERQKRTLTAELENARNELARRKANGEELTIEDFDQAAVDAFARVGINYRPPARNFEDSKGFLAEVSKWAVASMIGSLVDPELIPSMTRGGYVLSIIDHINATNAVFDIGTLNVIRKRELPTLNAVREDVAHLEVLIRRYELHSQRYEKFEKDYQTLFARARQQASRRQ